MLTGEVVSAPSGIHGFDCNTRLNAASVKKLKDAGFAYAIRYVARKSKVGDSDLTIAEAEAILDGGLALMPVQHVAKAGWKPSKDKGEAYGASAVKHVNDIGFPEGVNVWLDLEGVSSTASSDDIIQYCNSWFKVVEDAGYVPGVYVGANSGLSGDQLYWQLRTKHYWKSGSIVPEIPQRGYCMIQRIKQNDKVGGVEIDRNLTQADGFGNTPFWLTRAAELDADVPQELPISVIALATAMPAKTFAVSAKLPLPSPGLDGYYTADRHYGVQLAIDALVEIGRIWDARRAGTKIGIGDISKKGGGKITGHASHQKGVDLDMRMMKSDGNSAQMVYTDASYSRSLTQELVDLFYGNGVLAVQLVFFNDSAVAGVQPWPNHDNHLHVRFHIPGTQSPYPVLDQGKKGAAVRELQRRLGFWTNTHGIPFPPPAIDGDFGPTTHAALIAFQNASGLSQDGKAGSDVWTALPTA